MLTLILTCCFHLTRFRIWFPWNWMYSNLSIIGSNMQKIRICYKLCHIFSSRHAWLEQWSTNLPICCSMVNVLQSKLNLFGLIFSRYTNSIDILDANVWTRSIVNWYRYMFGVDVCETNSIAIFAWYPLNPKWQLNAMNRRMRTERNVI